MSFNPFRSGKSWKDNRPPLAGGVVSPPARIQRTTSQGGSPPEPISALPARPRNAVGESGYRSASPHSFQSNQSAQSEGSSASRVSVLATGVAVPSPRARDIHPNAMNDQSDMNIELYEGDRGGDQGGDHISESESSDHDPVVTNLGAGLLGPTPSDGVESVSPYNNFFLGFTGLRLPGGLETTTGEGGGIPVIQTVAPGGTFSGDSVAISVESSEADDMLMPPMSPPAAIIRPSVSDDEEIAALLVPTVGVSRGAGGDSGADTRGVEGEVAYATMSGPEETSWRSRNKQIIAVWLALLFLVIIITIVSVSIEYGGGGNNNGSGIIGPPTGPTNVPTAPRATTAPSISPDPTSSLSPPGTPTDSPAPTSSSTPTSSPRPIGTPTSSRAPTSRPTAAQPSTSLPPAVLSSRPTRSPSSTASDSPSVAVLVPTSSPSAESLPTVVSIRPTRSPSSTATDSPSVALPTLSPSAGFTLSPTMFASIPPSVIMPTTSPSFAPSPLPTTSLFPSSINQEILDLLVDNSFDEGESLNDPNSPQFAAYVWLVDNANLETYSEEQILRRYALATLYYSTNGSEWTRNELWLSNEDECDWYSRSRNACGLGRNFQRLELYFNNAQGTLPPELALLSNTLERMDISGGPQRTLTGSLPAEFGELTQLKVFRLQDNDLSGSIPSKYSTWSNLELIGLSNNRLTSTLPSEVGAWTKAETLSLSNNMIMGSLPAELGQLRRLQRLDLDGNVFTGAVPSEIVNMRRLENLNLNSNILTAIPTELGSLDSLRFLSLDDNSLGGTLHTEIGNMKRLMSLSVTRNAFVGTIPKEMGNLRDLRERLDLSSNQFSGQIPSDLGSINGKLRMLYLRNNLLTGSVPLEFAKLDKLQVLSLDTNMLTGEMPEEVCNVYNQTRPTISVDCEEVECPCCNYCCRDGEGCQCRYLNTELEFLCFF